MSSRQAAFRAATRLAQERRERVHVWCSVRDSRIVYPVQPESSPQPANGYVLATMEQDGSITPRP